MTRYAGRKAVVVGQDTAIGLAIAKRLVEGGAQVVLAVRTREEGDRARAELGPGPRLVRSPRTPFPATTADPSTYPATREPHTPGLPSQAGAGPANPAPGGAVLADAGPTGPDPAHPGSAHPGLSLRGPDLVHPGPTHPGLPDSSPAYPDPELADAADGADLLFADSVATARPLLARLRDTGAVVLTAPSPSASAVGALADEVLDRGIRVNAVAPACIEAPAAGADPLPPLGRRGSAEEVARAALFLATDATFTTGARLPVDGGRDRS